MKKMLFLLVASMSVLNAMKKQEQDASNFDLLPEETMQYLLSFVPTPGSYKDLVNLLSTSKLTQRLVTDPVVLSRIKTKQANF